jgi:hypothetical protein
MQYYEESMKANLFRKCKNAACMIARQPEAMAM